TKSLDELRFGRGRDPSFRLPVYPNDLLARGAGPPPSAEDPGLDRCRSIRNCDDALGEDASLPERVADLLARRVPPDHPERQDPRSQGLEVVAGVRGATQACFPRQVPENQDWSFTRDPFGPPEDILVGHEVTNDQDSPVHKALDDPEEPGGPVAIHGPTSATSRGLAPRRRTLPACSSWAS